jgi:ribosome-associated protein
VQISIPYHEYELKAVRSGGAGGQHVNKVSSRVELYFDVTKSAVLTEEQKATILAKLKTKLTEEGILRITEDTSRSQHANREAVVKKLHSIIEQALKKPKKRIAVRVSKAAKKKRVDNKKKLSDKKQLRKKNFD